MPIADDFVAYDLCADLVDASVQTDQRCAALRGRPPFRICRRRRSHCPRRHSLCLATCRSDVSGNEPHTGGYPQDEVAPEIKEECVRVKGLVHAVTASFMDLHSELVRELACWDVVEEFEGPGGRIENRSREWWSTTSVSQRSLQAP